MMQRRYGTEPNVPRCHWWSRCKTLPPLLLRSLRRTLRRTGRQTGRQTGRPDTSEVPLVVVPGAKLIMLDNAQILPPAGGLGMEAVAAKKQEASEPVFDDEPSISTLFRKIGNEITLIQKGRTRKLSSRSFAKCFCRYISASLARRSWRDPRIRHRTCHGSKRRL